MALPVAEDLKPVAVVYDCMDELSAFMGAPPALTGQEERLLEKADRSSRAARACIARNRIATRVSIVFRAAWTNGILAASNGIGEPEDQAALAHPRLGASVE